MAFISFNNLIVNNEKQCSLCKNNFSSNDNVSFFIKKMGYLLLINLFK
jgi:hypothetical protein